MVHLAALLYCQRKQTAAKQKKAAVELTIDLKLFMRLYTGNPNAAQKCAAFFFAPTPGVFS